MMFFKPHLLTEVKTRYGMHHVNWSAYASFLVRLATVTKNLPQFLL